MDNFDLFGKELSFNDVLQYDSLIENGTYDTNLLLCATIMNNPDYTPSSDVAKNVLNHIDKKQIAPPTQPVSEPAPKEPTPEPPKEDKISKTKIKREYIQLPDARLSKHINKYQSVET